MKIFMMLMFKLVFVFLLQISSQITEISRKNYKVNFYFSVMLEFSSNQSFTVCKYRQYVVVRVNKKARNYK
jgi:hypothetical protein